MSKGFRVLTTTLNAIVGIFVLVLLGIAMVSPEQLNRGAASIVYVLGVLCYIYSINTRKYKSKIGTKGS